MPSQREEASAESFAAIGAPPLAGPRPSMIDDSIYRRYLHHLLDGDRSACAAIVSDLLTAGVAVRDLYLDLLQRSMYEVGERWERSEISVAKEHVATAVTESLFALVYPRVFGTARCGRRAVVACVVNEYHQVGARMVADILELHGWDTRFVSVGGTREPLLAAIAEHGPQLLGLSLSLLRNLPALREVIATVHAAHPGLDIVVGGQAFRWGGAEELAGLPHVRYVASVVELERLIEE